MNGVRATVIQEDSGRAAGVFQGVREDGQVRKPGLLVDGLGKVIGQTAVGQKPVRFDEIYVAIQQPFLRPGQGAPVVFRLLQFRFRWVDISLRHHFQDILKPRCKLQSSATPSCSAMPLPNTACRIG